MPKATVSQDTVHKDLRTLEGGWVELRPLSFDQMLERRDKAMKMSMEQSGRQRSQIQKFDLDFANQWTRQFEFRHCIVDHNLEDDNGVKLDFNNSMSFSVLDPKIGSEIERYIDELNQEDEDSLEDFTTRSTPSTRAETNGQNTPSEES